MGVGVPAASWVVLIVLAARLPPGVLKEMAPFLPACVTMPRRLRLDVNAPRRAKVAVTFAALVGDLSDRPDP